MSPEQARGKAVDKRADIWAFGVVLYEMLTGQRLFVGGTISDTLAAVLKEEPDLEQAETVRGFKEILDDKHDAVAEGDFYMKGGIDEVCPTH
jgi:serine/threonine protein kinase